MDEVFDAYLRSVLVGGPERVTVTIAEYDETWPARYSAVEADVRRALGPRARSVDHIGSTAVPGLAAKPVVDVLLTVDDVEDEGAYVPALVSVGLVVRVREPGHRMLRTPDRDVHLHVYRTGAPQVQDYLDLRDWLRADVTARTRYESTKRQLAARDWPDRNHYARAKDDIVATLLAEARAWRSAGQSGGTGAPGPTPPPASP